MIELVQTMRYTLGTEWTDEDRAIIRRRHGALFMAAHDTTDAIYMSGWTRMATDGFARLARRMIIASNVVSGLSR